MSKLMTLEAYQKFLQEKVASGIKLQKANDNNVSSYELVRPQVHIGWVPPKGYLPEDMDYTVPCIIVGYDEADNDGQDAELSMRLSFAVYSPGKHETKTGGGIQYTPDFQGYVDLLNLMERTERELTRQRVIGGVTTIQFPLKSGMYTEQPYPYWYGWLTFKTRGKSSTFVEDIASKYL